MQISTSSSFTAYELTEQEQRSGYTFNEANRAVIQNLISAAAEEFVAVGMQCTTKELSIEERLRVSHLQGQVHILRHLLQSADATKEEVEAMQAKLNNPDNNSL